MSADKMSRPASRAKSPPRQPDYRDEISCKQMNAIRKLADPDGKHAAGRVLLYAEAW